MADEKNQEGIIITEPVVLMFPQFFEPKRVKRNGKEVGEPKYSVQMIITKANAKALVKRAKEIAKAHFGNDLDGVVFPFKDGDKEAEKARSKGYNGDHYEDMVVLKASSKYPPGLCDRQGNDVIDPKKIYSGIHARLELNFVAYDPVGEGGKSGVTAYFNSAIVWAEGTRLTGKSAQDTFAEYMGKDTEKDVDDDDEIPF